MPTRPAARKNILPGNAAPARPDYDCDLGPAGRHDHQTKQVPGWTVTCHQPGTVTWTTPGNRSHTATPAEYWE